MSIRLKRMLCGLLCIAFLGTVSVNINAANANVNQYISVIGFDKNVDYSKLMWQCATDGSPYALKVGAVYEQQRNLKIERLGMKYDKTSYFVDYHTGKDILSAMKTGPKITRLKSEHRIAGLVYEYLNKKGFTDPVIAGILGNMMAECGGQTLELRWDIYGGEGSYYGLCQWSLYYNPAVKGRDVTGQMDYLMSNIEKNMRYFGGNYNYFHSIKNAGEAARYFANYYERGSGASVRVKNANKALAWINS